MKSTSLAVACMAALAANAQEFNQTSAPFQLTVTSADGSINDTLSTCHTGAALESLCLSHGVSTSKGQPEDPAVFNFNTTDNIKAPAPGLGQPGVLTWNLPSTPPIPSGVRFFYDPTTNIAFPILVPGTEDAQLLAFNQQDLLTIQGYVDWSVNPPNGTGGYKEYQRWFACISYFSGYQYQTLNWGLGPGQPEQPSCVSVQVKRVFNY